MGDVNLTLDHYIKFKKHIGVDGLLITGLPGTGKSNFASAIAGLCMKERKENFIVPFDVQCEFLNAAQYANKIIMILPEELGPKNFHFHNFPYKNEIIYKDYSDLRIADYLDDNSEKTLIAIYDNHYRGNQLYKRTDLWVKLSQQLLDRTYLLENAIGLLFHEAGIYFPQMPIDKHWKAVKDFSELFVDFRKRLLRAIFISQMDKEIINTVRGKCLWRIYRKGFVSQVGNPEAIYKSTPFLAINQYHFLFGGLYTMANEAQKIPEHHLHTRVIPILPEQEETPIEETSQRDDMIKKLYSELGWTQQYIADFAGLSRQRISQITNS